MALRDIAAAAVIAGLMALAIKTARAPRPETVEDDEDWTTDIYVMGLLAHGEHIELETKLPFPFIGDRWSQED